MNQHRSNQLSFRTTSLFAKLLIDLFLFRRNASLYEFISCHFSTFSRVASGKVSKKLRIGIRHLLLWLPNFLERVKPTRKKRAAVHPFPFLRDRRKARFVNHDNRDYGPGYHDVRTSCNLRNGDWAKRSVDVE